MRKYYSLYKGENEIAFGSLEEIAKKLNINIETVKFYGTKAYSNRVINRKGTNYRILVRC